MPDDAPISYPATNKPDIITKLAKAADEARTVAEYAAKLNGQTQESLARAIDSTPSRVNWILSGKSHATVAEEEKLQKALRLPSDLPTNSPPTQANRARLVRDF